MYCQRQRELINMEYTIFSGHAVAVTRSPDLPNKTLWQSTRLDAINMVMVLPGVCCGSTARSDYGLWHA
jgi:hypothetical protein